jgi:hypothetical protein
MKHFTKCTDYEGHIDDVEDEMIDDEVSIGNYIEMMENKISLTKHLSVSITHSPITLANLFTPTLIYKSFV